MCDVDDARRERLGQPRSIQREGFGRVALGLFHPGFPFRWRLGEDFPFDGAANRVTSHTLPCGWHLTGRTSHRGPVCHGDYGITT